MKMYKTAYLLIAFLITVLPSCDYTGLDVDPNRPTSAPPSLILNGVLLNMRSSAWNPTMRWNQYYCINYNYYGNNEYWSGAAGLDYTRLNLS